MKPDILSENIPTLSSLLKSHVGQAGSLRRDGIPPVPFSWSSSLRFLCVLCASALITQPLSSQTDEAFIGNRAKYWAFQKVVRPPAPATRNPWTRNPIDAFI